MPSTSTADEGERKPDRKAQPAESLVYGPLDIKRYLKDDGRALLLYELREHGKQ